MKYHVTSYYCATGMDGIPDIEDYGIVEAKTEEEAKDVVCVQEIPEDRMYGPNNAWSPRDFMKGCLTAQKIEGK